MKKVKYKKQLLRAEHLKSLRSLTQFSRCWHIIDSHLILYKKYLKLENDYHALWLNIINADGEKIQVNREVVKQE